MTPQAKNSIALYEGQAPSKIKMLLGIQSQSVVNELKDAYDAPTIDELAVKLSSRFPHKD